MDEFSIFIRKTYTRIKYYNQNNYNVQYFLNDELVEINNEKDKKYTFIPDED